MNESMERGGQPQISRIPLRIAAAILLLVVSVVCSAPAQNGPTVGDEFEIRHRYETSDRGREGSSGSSRGRSALLELTTSELAKRFGMSSPTISRHLSLLEVAGLVSSERQGQRVLYRLNRDTLVNSPTGFAFEICPVGGPLKRESRRLAAAGKGQK
jgi:DNA-binding transcriptional ArsR family regulator